jgi:uncharacterized membrane protein
MRREAPAEDWRQRSYYTGASLQPNVLSRGTRDQAIVSGVAASVGYAWGAWAHSFLRSTADRLPMSSRSHGGRVVAGVLVDIASVAIASAAMKLVPQREQESSRPPARSCPRPAPDGNRATRSRRTSPR